MAISLGLGLLIIRLVGGLTIAAHGAQKLFGWFDGPGLTKITQGLEKQGFKPPWLWVILVILGEFGGGLSVALGFLTPLGAAGMFGAMLMAIFKSHWKNGFWNSKRGLEFPLALLAMGVGIRIDGAWHVFVGCLLRDCSTIPAGFLGAGGRRSDRRCHRTHHQSSNGCADGGQVEHIIAHFFCAAKIIGKFTYFSYVFPIEGCYSH